MLGRQLDAQAPELLVAVHCEGAPLLCAQLEGRQDGFPAIAVANVDYPSSVGERGRATPAGQVVVDLGAIDHRAERADVTRCRQLERRSLDERGPPLPVAPFLGEVGA